MPAPTQSNSYYKKRVISAMLDGPSVEGSPPSEEPRKVWSREIVYWFFALAFISAAGVFFLLYHRDSSAFSGAEVATVSVPRIETRPVPPPAQQPAPVASSQNITSVPPSLTEAPKAKFVDSESLPVRIVRARTYQNVGPVKVRLAKVDLKRQLCDVNFQSRDHRFTQRRFQVNRALVVKVGGNAPVEVTVSTIEKNSIVLSLDETPSNVPAAKISNRR